MNQLVAFHEHLPALVTAAGGLDRRRAAFACRCLRRIAQALAQRTDRQAAVGRHPHAVRLARHRPDRADQSGHDRARPHSSSIMLH